MSEIVKNLERIHRNSQISAYMHFGAAERMSNLHLWLGIPTALISVCLGSFFFADLQGAIPNVAKWIASVSALLAAVLSTLQTFFNPKSNKSKHREIANSYLSVNRKSGALLASYHDKVTDIIALSKKLDEINILYDSVNNSTVDYPTNKADFDRAKRKNKGIEKD